MLDAPVKDLIMIKPLRLTLISRIWNHSKISNWITIPVSESLIRLNLICTSLLQYTSHTMLNTHLRYAEQYLLI